MPVLRKIFYSPWFFSSFLVIIFPFTSSTLAQTQNSFTLFPERFTLQHFNYVGYQLSSSRFSIKPKWMWFRCPYVLIFGVIHLGIFQSYSGTLLCLISEIQLNIPKIFTKCSEAIKQSILMKRGRGVFEITYGECLTQTGCQSHASGASFTCLYSKFQRCIEVANS